MNLKRRIIASVFAASFAASLLQRGGYFFTHEVLGFSQAQNLLLALLVGITYVVGATSSHRLATRFGERRTLLRVLISVSVINLVVAYFSASWLLVLALATIAALQGVMWPIFESYMSAGETPQNLGRVLGRYNIGWALAVAPSLAVSGALIASGSPRRLFLLAALLFGLVYWSCRAFPAQPPHLAAGHAARPDFQTLKLYRGLLRASRFAMLGSYTLLYVLAPLMPEIMKHLGFSTGGAARASSLIDVARLSCFVGLFAYRGWHGRKAPIALAIVALPLGFSLVLFGASVGVVVGGELLFGAGAGFLYTASLYYAQVVQNASVDAGGAHEALIGLGYALGPSAGLIGTALAHGAGPGSPAYVRGMTVATLPLIAACSIAALWPLLRAHRA